MKCANIKWIFETDFFLFVSVKQSWNLTERRGLFFIKFFFTNEQKSMNELKGLRKNTFYLIWLYCVSSEKLGDDPYDTRNKFSSFIYYSKTVPKVIYRDINTKWKHMCGEFNQKKKKK